VPNADQSSTGLLGFMDALGDTARKFQEFEDRYRTNEASFQQIQQRFQQMQDSTSQMHSLAEERMAGLNALNVELKVRHSQGEQTWQETQSLLGEIRAQQTQWEKRLAGGDGQKKAEAERAKQLADAVRAVEGLAKRLDGRQAQLEASLKAVQEQQTRWEQTLALGGPPAASVSAVEARAEALEGRQAQVEGSVTALQARAEEHGQRYIDHEKILSAARDLAHQVGDRVAQAEKTVSILQATTEAERALVGHFEKSLEAARSTAAEMQRRQAEMEAAMRALKASGSEAPAASEKAVAALRGQIDQAHQAAARAAEQAQQAVAQAAEKAASLEQKAQQALESAQSAQKLAAEAMAKAAEKPAEGGVPIPVAKLSPEDQKKAGNDFQHFLTRCHTDHKNLVEQTSRLQTQTRMTLEGLPSKADGAVQKFLELGRGQLEQSWNQWVQSRDKKVHDVEKRYDELMVKSMEAQQALERELSKAGGASPAQQPPAIVTEWMEAVEANTATQTSELRFIKTLMWVSLAGLGIGYVLVVYALILKP